MKQSKTKHTPGPWKFAGESLNANYFCVDIPDQPLVDVKLEANAALIAAAPELLSALELCLEHGMLGTLMVEGEIINLTEVVENALDMARGES